MGMMFGHAGVDDELLSVRHIIFNGCRRERESIEEQWSAETSDDYISSSFDNKFLGFWVFGLHYTVEFWAPLRKACCAL